MNWHYLIVATTVLLMLFIWCMLLYDIFTDMQRMAWLGRHCEQNPYSCMSNNGIWGP